MPLTHQYDDGRRAITDRAAAVPQTNLLRAEAQPAESNANSAANSLTLPPDSVSRDTAEILQILVGIAQKPQIRHVEEDCRAYRTGPSREYDSEFTAGPEMVMHSILCPRSTAMDGGVHDCRQLRGRRGRSRRENKLIEGDSCEAALEFDSLSSISDGRANLNGCVVEDWEIEGCTELRVPGN